MRNAQAEQMVEGGTHVAFPRTGAIFAFFSFPELSVFHAEVASISSLCLTPRNVWEVLDNFQKPGEGQEGSLPALRQLRRPCVLQAHSYLHLCSWVYSSLVEGKVTEKKESDAAKSQRELSDAN